MMVTIHDKKSIDFETLGLGALLPSSCAVKEELNGLFELELSHPYDEWGKWERIEIGRIIVASTPRGLQPFRIYKVNPTMESVSVSARHIFYDMLDNYISSCMVSSQSPQAVLDTLKANFNYPMPFDFSTTLTGLGSMTCTKINPVKAILGSGEDADSFISIFGGELLRDGYQVAFLPSIGADRGVSIRYGKNLVGLKIEDDASEVVTRIVPVGKDGLLGEMVDSDYILSYPYPKISVIENAELTTKVQLANWALELFTDGIDLPSVNIQVNFQLLSKTAEYKDFAILEDVQLGDVVTVSNTKMNFHKKAKVISYKWNCLLDKYEDVELGDFVADITSSITSGEKSLATAMSTSTEVKQIYGLLNGKITINQSGLYVAMDTDSLASAKKILLLGSKGIQHSGTGINGEWKTVIDDNGNIV